MKLNVAEKVPVPTTHEGARAVRLSAEQELRRSVMSCMLWEDSFYESGEDIAARIAALVPKARPAFAAAVAAEARWKMKLRHAPLLVVREMARHPEHKALVGRLLPDVIGRPDEITEFLAIYWKDGPNQPLSAQVKKGLARAFNKFDEYTFAKYDRDGKVKLRDALFLTHAKPADVSGRPLRTKAERHVEHLDLDENLVQRQVPRTPQERLFEAIVNRRLKPPDTWEVALSDGADKKETFERLMTEGKLGALAFLRNLRNMQQANVSKTMVAEYASTVNLSMVLPFRYVAAARVVPAWEDVVDALFLRGCAQQPKLSGKTVLVIDVSGSMYGWGNISKRSDMSRIDAAAALAAIAREVCVDARIYATAGDDGCRIHATAEMPARRGMALVDVVAKRELASTLGGGGIFLVQCLDYIKQREKTADRIIVLSDEQDCDNDPQTAPAKADAFGRYNYLINVSVERSGIGYKPKWTHIDGWSEAILDYIRAAEMQTPEEEKSSQ